MLATNLPFERTDAAFIDFVEGFKVMSNKQLLENMEPVYRSRVGEWADAHGGREPSTPEEVAEVMTTADPYRWYTWTFRRAQELMWESCDLAFRPYRQAWEADLQEPNRPGALGRLILHPENPIPRWSLVHDIHLQPGGFHGDPLAGPIYELGARIHNLRKNDDNAHQHLVASIPPDADYERILDLGCGTGRSTLPFKERFPGADVYGIEISEALCRYAHARAEEMGIGVTFEQMNSAAMSYPDNHFDIVSAHLVFHEMPPKEVRLSLEESLRVMKPGGWMVISDLAPFTDLTPLKEFLTRWQDRNNGEPFSNLYMETDIVALLQDVGFTDVEAGGRWDARRGRPFPFIYTARKPA